jgi:phage/plasmid-associated DNA primase
LFGDEVLSTTTDAMSSNPRFFTQQLVGKKLVLLPDARMKYILDSTIDLLKRITGGTFYQQKSSVALSVKR